MVDWESHRWRRHVREATWTWKTEAAINRDEGNYELNKNLLDMLKEVFDHQHHTFVSTTIVD